MSNSFADYRKLIEARLEELLPDAASGGTARLNEAIRYAVFPGGKRLRPILSLMGARIVDGALGSALPAACATELLHASSLIFDDLPAMDDADIRRGRAALHLVFGEDVALLAALALLNRAYALFGSSERSIREAAACIGAMIGGQAADLAIRTAGASAESFELRNRKTTALMRLTLTSGAIACNASDGDFTVLAQCGERLGEAFQICDDLLDECACCAQTGKTARQDARHDRPSHLASLGVKRSRDRVASLIAESRESLLLRFGDTEAVAALMQAMDAMVKYAAPSAAVGS